MKFDCPAKINLFLKLAGKRADGYHELESLFAFLDLADELEVKKSDEFQLEILGEFASFIDPQHNLFTKILEFFVEKFSVSKNLHVKIIKNIPVGAGLGGGSSDAASFMRALNKIFSLKLSKLELQKISLNFGSDIAFFFEDQASIAQGRGDLLTSFRNFEPIPVLLINPRIHLATKEVFSRFSQEFSFKAATEELLEKDIFDLIKNFPNDLTEPAISIAPVISEILTKLKNYGAKITKMTGSGSTCFGIFPDKESLKIAQEKFSKNYPDFFVREARILSHA